MGLWVWGLEGLGIGEGCDISRARTTLHGYQHGDARAHLRFWAPCLRGSTKGFSSWGIRQGESRPVVHVYFFLVMTSHMQQCTHCAVEPSSYKAQLHSKGRRLALGSGSGSCHSC